MSEHPGLDPKSPPPSLEGVERSVRVEAIKEWFYENFEDPVHAMPYNGREGGYLYIHGGPFEAADQIWGAFAGAAEDDEIEEAIDDIDAEGSEWAPAGHRVRYPEEDELEDPVAPLADRLAALGGQLDRIESAVAAVREWQKGQGDEVPGIGHNGPPEDDEELDLPGIETSIVEVRGELARSDPEDAADAAVVERAEGRFRRFYKWLKDQLTSAPKSIVQGAIAGAAGLGMQRFLKDPDGTLEALRSTIETLAIWSQHLSALF
ncbi:MAG TPA: hypothetical protein VF680_01780 [Allosphingosinicella sp.]|jgi:hypothetical protein